MRIPIKNPPKPSTLFGVPDNYAAFGKHAGIDYPVGEGTPVYASVAGTLSVLHNDKYHGNVTDIYRNGKYYRVMHLSSFKRLSGQVKEGDLIAYSGNTGLSTGPHIHWDVRTQKTPASFSAFQDPLKLLKEEKPMATLSKHDISREIFCHWGRSATLKEKEAYSKVEAGEMRKRISDDPQTDKWIARVENLKKEAKTLDPGKYLVK